VSAAAQGMTIASMMLCGLVMGLAFDVYRVASHRFHVARWLLPAIDVAFWAASTLGVFAVLLSNNQGEVRLYVFLGLGIGVTGYFGMFSPWVVKLSGKLIDAITAVFRFLWRLIRAVVLAPVVGIVRVLAKLLDVAFIVTAALALWIGKLLFRPLRAIGGWGWEKMLPARRKMTPVTDFFRKLRDRAREIRNLFRKKE